jgi:signal transduction histidine kinase
VMEPDLIDRLAQHRTLGAAPHAELAWLAAHGTIRTLDTGEVLSVKGRQVEALYIILSGRLALFVDRGAGPDKIIEWRAGDVAGLLPFSRLNAPPGDSRALEPLEILAIPREHLRAMTQECFEVTSILVHSMVDRARLFTSSDLLNEKMISLGKLSAGLAHELNNPASAIKRCAALLSDRFKESEAAARTLAAAALNQTQIAAIDAVRTAAGANPDHLARTPLEQSDREEAFAAWLSKHAVDAIDTGALAASGVNFESLDRLAAALPPPALQAALAWLAASCAIRNLSARIQDSAAQVSNLVRAVKGFTHMDQANVAEPVDVSAGLADTVEILQAKARGRSAAVSLELEPGLPSVRGFAAELNHVWSNLIDNALDAVATGGKVSVLANRENQDVVVRVVDDGAGIPAAIRGLIFDPFFTTKPMGQGVGLGLDIARRLVRHNEGAIEFESAAGRTEFRVTLPVARLQST